MVWPAEKLRLSSVQSLLRLSGAGGIYLVDSGSYYVRRIFANGTIAAACGTRASFGYSGNNGPATSGRLWTPSGVALNDQGGFFVADPLTNTIRRVRDAPSLAP